MMNEDLASVVEVIRAEHRRTQIVFGAVLIIICLILIVVAPTLVRSTVDEYFKNYLESESLPVDMGTDAEVDAPQDGTTTEAL